MMLILKFILRLSMTDICETYLSQRAITGGSLKFVNTDCKVLALRLINRYFPECLRDRAHPFPSCSRGTPDGHESHYYECDSLMTELIFPRHSPYTLSFAKAKESRSEKEVRDDRARTRGQRRALLINLIGHK